MLLFFLKSGRAPGGEHQTALFVYIIVVHFGNGEQEEEGKKPKIILIYAETKNLRGIAKD